MTKYYTKIIPFELAKKLANIGYSKDSGYQYDSEGRLCDPASPDGCEGVCEAPTYAEAIDFLIEKNVYIVIYPTQPFGFDAEAGNQKGQLLATVYGCKDWHTVAEFIIEDVLRVIK